MYDMTAAHMNLPLGTFVKVTNLRNGRSAVLRVNDRGPYVDGRIVEYLKDHPQSTTGDIAKGLNASRDTIAAGLSHIARASQVTED